MKKNLTLHNDEIDLTEILLTLWSEKKIIIIITFFSILIAIGYIYQKPSSFRSSLIISKSTSSQFIKFLPLIEFLREEKKKEDNLAQEKLIDSKHILDRFRSEIMDYDEVIAVLKNTEIIKKEISQLSEKDQLNVLYNYAQLLTLNKGKKDDEIILEFIWPNKSESRNIIEQIMKLTLVNLKKTLFSDITDYFKIKKNAKINIDLKRIEFLTEQSSIARGLNLAESEETNIIYGENNLSLNITQDLAYYLRGYKAIDKEIYLVEQRKYDYLAELEELINTLKASETKWVEYNIFLLKTKSINYSKAEILMASIVLGLIIGGIYVLISNRLLVSKSTRTKKTN